MQAPGGERQFKGQAGPSKPHVNLSKQPGVSGPGAKVEAGTHAGLRAGSALGPQCWSGLCRMGNSQGLWRNSLDADTVAHGKATQTGHARHIHSHRHSISYTHTTARVHSCQHIHTSQDLPAQRIKEKLQRRTLRTGCTCAVFPGGGAGWGAAASCSRTRRPPFLPHCHLLLTC